jgi:hypothetical protein
LSRHDDLEFTQNLEKRIGGLDKSDSVISKENRENEDTFQPGLLDVLEDKSAMTIQAFFRMKIAQKRSRKLRIVLRKIILIQRWFRIWISKKRTKTMMLRSNRSAYQ